MTELENIIKSLRSEIKFEKDCGNNLDNTDWDFEEGIIISVNDLEKLLDACEGKLPLCVVRESVCFI